tara:strand:+ start:161 stop:427 length:267 start_codon:yes stop_codon:yes gene_type:complete
MRIYIYKIIIAVVSLYILFEFTIGSRIDFYSNQIKSINDQQKRIEFKEKILKEMEKGSKKENYFSEKERIIISNFLNKIFKELKIKSN